MVDKYKTDPVFVFIRDIILGKVIELEDPVRRHNIKIIETSNKEKLTAVRVLGIITKKYHSIGTKEKKEYTVIAVDDGTGTIQVKAWEEKAKELDLFQIGDVIDIIAKPRVSKDQETYLVIEKAFKIEDYRHEIYLRAKRAQRYIKKSFKIPEITIEADKEEKERLDEAKRLIWELIVQRKEGVTLDEIIKETEYPKKIVETIIQEFLNKGDIYEPIPLKFKKIA